MIWRALWSCESFSVADSAPVSVSTILVGVCWPMDTAASRPSPSMNDAFTPASAALVRACAMSPGRGSMPMMSAPGCIRASRTHKAPAPQPMSSTVSWDSIPIRAASAARHRPSPESSDTAVSYSADSRPSPPVATILRWPCTGLWLGPLIQSSACVPS